ncbi:Uncharacterized protein T4E_10387, partial [Trichinella pseudospiralis]
LDPNVTLICMEIRIVPFALREKIDAELDKLVEQGVLEPVDHHPVWSTPNVTPVKSDGTVRSCGDYKCTINKALRKHAYSIPAVSQLLASLSGGKVYAKLDLAQAYQHNSELMTLQLTRKQSSLIVANFELNIFNLGSALLLEYLKITLIKLFLAFKECCHTLTTSSLHRVMKKSWQVVWKPFSMASQKPDCD